MRKTLKALIAVVCVLLAVAVALLIYLESEKPEGDAPLGTEPAEAITSTGESGTGESEAVSTEEVPVETREDGAPNYDLSGDEADPATEPEESGVPSEAETYVPDDDELPQMPIG